METTVSVIRTILADDHPIVREGIKAVLQRKDGVRVVGDCTNGAELLQELEHTDCDLVILDLSMPDVGGLEVIEKVRALRPGVRIIVLTMHKDRDRIRAALSGGVDGYVLKEDIYDRLASAVEDVMAGKKAYSAAVTGMIVEDYTGGKEQKAAAEMLTRREREVLRLIADGLSNKAIADQLNISVRTAEFHRANIMEKLDIRSVAGLVKYALANGLA